MVPDEHCSSMLGFVVPKPERYIQAGEGLPLLFEAAVYLFSSAGVSDQDLDIRKVNLNSPSWVEWTVKTYGKMNVK